MWKYLLFLIAYHTLGRLPIPLLYWITGIMGSLSFLLSGKTRRNVSANMRHILGSKASDKDVRRAVRQVFINSARYYGDLVHMPHLDLSRFFHGRLTYHGYEENMVPAAESGRGVALMSAHFGTPELAFQGLRKGGMKVFALTEPLEPPRLSHLFNKLRSAHGHTAVPVNLASVKAAVRTVKSGGIVGLMYDRDIKGPRASLPFCGREALMPTGPIELAMRTGAVVVPVFCPRRANGKVEAFLEEPVEMVDSGDFAADVRTNALKLLARFEKYLLRDPGQWIVLESVWTSERSASDTLTVAGQVKS